MKIYDGGFYRAAPEKLADAVNIGSLRQQVSRKGVAQGVNALASFFALTKILWAAAVVICFFLL